VLVAVLMLATACAGNRSPVAIAGQVAHQGTPVIEAVDAVQRYIAAQETAGVIPRNQAVTAMEAIGKSLAAAEKAGSYLDAIVRLPANSAESDPLMKQLQDALAVASSQAALSLVPIGSEPTRQQVGKLLVSVSNAIAQVNNIILSRR
jgi:hypothetical protein